MVTARPSVVKNGTLGKLKVKDSKVTVTDNLFTEDTPVDGSLSSSLCFFPVVFISSASIVIAWKDLHLKQYHLSQNIVSVVNDFTGISTFTRVITVQ